MASSGFSASLKYEVESPDAAAQYASALATPLQGKNITITTDANAVILNATADSTAALRAELLAAFDAVAEAGIH